MAKVKQSAAARTRALFRGTRFKPGPEQLAKRKEDEARKRPKLWSAYDETGGRVTKKHLRLPSSWRYRWGGSVARVRQGGAEPDRFEAFDAEGASIGEFSALAAACNCVAERLMPP